MAKKPRKSDASDDTDLDLNDPLDSRILSLTGDVTESLVREAVIGIFRLSEADAVKPITLIVNTYGGSVDETFALYDAMKMSLAPVRTVGLGKVMSAGCLILAAGTKGQRLMGRNARLMYHAGYEHNGGDILEQQNNLKEFARTEVLYDKLVAKETGRTFKQVEALYKKKRVDRYLTATQALKFGFVDRLV